MPPEHPPKKAFILAAGMGSRLRPYTDTLPKPMVPVAGKSIIARTLEKLAEMGVEDVVVNTHHLAPVLEAHLGDIKTPRIRLSHEETLLETGGGIRKALPFFGSDPFYIINGDALWEDTPDATALERLAGAWDSATMDILLLLQPVGSMTLTRSYGDYTLGPDGRAKRVLDKTGDYMFAGIRIAAPRIYDGVTEENFSFLKLMDAAEKKGRLYGLPHLGAWHHISTPEDYECVDRAFREKEPG